MVVIRVWCLSYHINLWQQANDNRVLVLPPDLYCTGDVRCSSSMLYVQLFILLYIQNGYNEFNIATIPLYSPCIICPFYDYLS